MGPAKRAPGQKAASTISARTSQIDAISARIKKQRRWPKRPPRDRLEKRLCDDPRCRSSIVLEVSPGPVRSRNGLTTSASCREVRIANKAALRYPRRTSQPSPPVARGASTGDRVGCARPELAPRVPQSKDRAESDPGARERYAKYGRPPRRDDESARRRENYSLGVSRVTAMAKQRARQCAETSIPQTGPARPHIEAASRECVKLEIAAAGDGEPAAERRDQLGAGIKIR